MPQKCKIQALLDCRGNYTENVCGWCTGFISRSQKAVPKLVSTSYRLLVNKAFSIRTVFLSSSLSSL